MFAVQDIVIQVTIMALLISVGFVCSKRGMVSQSSAKDMGNLLVNWVIPCLIIDSFQIEHSDERMQGLILSFVLSALAHIVLIILASLVWRGKQNMVERLAIIYTNAGFMGIPLVSAVFGAEGVFYASIFSCVLQAFFWSHGVSVLDGNVSLANIKRILFSPAIISCMIGILLFFTRVTIPEPVSPAIKYMAGMNTPLAMIVAGISIANTDIRDVLRSVKFYLVILSKLIIAPICVALVFKFIPVDLLLKEIIVLQMSCPMAVTVGVAMTQRGQDSGTASKYFVVTILLSIFTIPIVFSLTDYILRI